MTTRKRTFPHPLGEVNGASLRQECVMTIAVP
jgi:hypothetical protein